METKEQIIISHPEHDLLSKHLEVAVLSDFNKKRLYEVLKNASVIKEEEMPADVVSIESFVKIKDQQSAREFEFQIVLPSHADFKRKTISVYSPMAIAIMGFRVGDVVSWEMPDGVKTMEILGVSAEPLN